MSFFDNISWFNRSTRYKGNLEKQFKELEQKLDIFNSQIEQRNIFLFNELKKHIDIKIKGQRKLIQKYMDDYYAISGMSESDYNYKGSQALDYLIKNYDINTVLDIGSGAGLHSNLFTDAGCNVTAIDYGKSPLYRENTKVTQIIADFNQYTFNEQYDCVWCCHVLEHQTNPGMFLKKIHSVTKEGGVVAITVPPLKQIIVGGHVCLWNAGLLLYHLVLAGFDCSNAHIKTYGYNISVIVEKHSIDVSSIIGLDCGDIKVISPYLPKDLNWYPNDNDTPYDGSIMELNWK